MLSFTSLGVAAAPAQQRPTSRRTRGRAGDHTPLTTIRGMDRHARHRRTPLDRHRRPVDGFRMRSPARFAHVVQDAMTALPPALVAEFAGVDVTLAEVPVVPEGGEMLLGTAIPGQPDPAATRDHITLFRRPLEARARDRPDLRELILEVLVQQLALLRGFDDDELHDLGWP
jgi:predicted Zn-dependent protease with MMP-like domain